MRTFRSHSGTRPDSVNWQRTASMRSTTAERNAPHGALCRGAGQMGSNDLPAYAPRGPRCKRAPRRYARTRPGLPTGPSEALSGLRSGANSRNPSARPVARPRAGWRRGPGRGCRSRAAERNRSRSRSRRNRRRWSGPADRGGPAAYPSRPMCRGPRSHPRPCRSRRHRIRSRKRKRKRNRSRTRRPSPRRCGRNGALRAPCACARARVARPCPRRRAGRRRDRLRARARQPYGHRSPPAAAPVRARRPWRRAGVPPCPPRNGPPRGPPARCRPSHRNRRVRSPSCSRRP